MCGLSQQRHDPPDLRGEETASLDGAGFAQRGSALLANWLGDAGHARGGRAGPLAVGEDVQIRQRGLLDEAQRVLEQCVGLGRKAGDQVGPQGNAWAKVAGPVDHCHRAGPQMTPPHPLQDQIAAGLQRQV